MKISCQSCQAKYTIADEKVLGKIVKIRCKKCGATIVINGNESGAQAGGSQSGAEAQAFDYAGQAGGEQWTVNVADGDQRTMSFDEIVAAFKSGVVTDETYCWKDGMADWLPIREVPELYSAAGDAPQHAPADQTAQEPAAGGYDAPPAYGQPAFGGGGHEQEEATAAGYSGYGGQAAASSNGNGATNGLFGSSPAPAAARRQGRAGAQDLFGGVSQAGGEDDVMTSAPAGMPQASNDPGKLTGQRNENSVLFSLNALTQSAPKEEAPQAPGEGSGLIDIRALSASMGNTGGPTKGSHVDDIMNLGGGGAFSAALAAPVLSPPSMDGGGMLGFDGTPRKDNTKLMLIAIIGTGFLVAVAIVLAVVLKKPAEPTVTTTVAPTADTTTAPALTASAVAAAAPSASVAANDTSGAQPTAPSAGGGGDTSGGHKHHGGGGMATGGGGGGTGSSPPPFVPPAPAAAPAAKSGGTGSLADQMKSSVGPDTNFGGSAPAAQSTAAFDRGAAAAALGSVNVNGCKKSDGPTGSGHIRVTFSPSGNVVSAVVDQPPFSGTAVGGCVAGKFRSAHIPAFGGSPVPVGKSFTID